jgi:ABC-type nitrate/sulfonate/bicarbonate transport system substrate-binding protein
MSKAMAVAALLAAMVLANAARAAETVVLQLHGPPQFEFAGYYAALWQGFYRDAGLEVDIRPGADRGQPAIDPMRQVTEGRAQFATGSMDLVVRTAQGLPLLLLAPIFQQSGAAVYYRTENDFASPAALAKAKLGRLPASDILDIELATALRAEGIDPAKLKAVSLEPGQSFSALADKSIDAAIGSAWDLPFLAREKGIALKSFNPADYRVEFYGDTLFTLQRRAKTQSPLVRAFYTASLRGWDYALQHPGEITQRLLADLPHPNGIADAAGFARYQADVARRLARYPDVALGHSNPDRWERIEASMVGAGALLRTADTDDFVYDPDAEARNRTDQRAFLILGVPIAGGVAVAVWLALRWRRRPAEAEPASAEQPAVPAPGAAPAPKPAAGAIVMAPARPAPTGTREPAVADLNALLAGLERAIRQRVPRRAAFRLSLLPELWRCRAETPTVRALVLDLVAAAGDDLKGSGELVVGTRNYGFDAASLADTPGAQLGEYVRVTVRDSGPGLSEEALDRIFDPVSTPRRALVRAAETMRGLGGFARVESAEGVGTAVHLYFPRANAAAAPEKKPAEAAE